MANVLRRKRGESDVDFLERAADAARKVSGSVDTRNGALCPCCAPSGSAEGERTVEILGYATCYNCRYGQDAK